MQNKRLYASIAFAVSLMLIGCGQKSADESIKDAKSYLENNNLNAASIELKNAISQSPKAIEARYLLGKVNLKLGNAAGAEKEFRIVLDDPNANFKDLNSLLLQSLLDQSDFNSIVKIYSETPPKDCQACDSIYLWSKNSLNSIDPTAPLVEEVTDTSNLKPFDAAIKTYFSGDLSKAYELMKSTGSLSAGYEKLIAGQIFLSARASEEAINSFKSLTMSKPQLRWVKLLLVQSYMQAKNYEDAKTLIADILSTNAKNPLANYLRALIAFQENDIETAEKYAKNAYANGYTMDSNRLLLGVIQYKLGQYESSLSNLRAGIKSVDDGHVANKILFTVQLRLGYDIEAAESLIERKNLDQSDIPLINQAITALEGKAGQESKRIKLYNLLNSISPSEIELKQQKAIIQLDFGDANGLNLLSDILENDFKNDLSYLALARYYLDKKQTKEALNSVDEWIQKEPSNVTPLNLKGAIYYSIGQLTKAEDAYTKASQIDEANPPTFIFRANKATGEKNYASAKKIIENLLTKHPEHIGALRMHVLLNQKLGLPLSGSIPFVEKAADLDNASNEVKLLLAGLYVNTNQNDKAESWLESIDEKEIAKNNQYWILRYQLAEQQADNSVLDTIFRNWQKNLPNIIDSYITHAAHYAKYNQYDKAIQTIGLGKSNIADNMALDIAYISYLLTDNQLSRAESEIDNIANRHPEEITVHYLRGRLFALQTNFDSALKELKLHYDATKSDLTAYLIANVLRYKQQDISAFLEKHLTLSPADTRSRKLLADTYISTQPKRAILHYQEFIKYDQSNALVYNNLAWLTNKSGATKASLPLIDKAYNLDTGNADIIDTYLEILIDAKDFKKANEIINAIKNPSTLSGTIAQKQELIQKQLNN